jgi:hypothetical protein
LLSGRFVVHKECCSQSLTVLSGTLFALPTDRTTAHQDSPDAHIANRPVDAVQQ